ncbi:hypothetical protein RB195_014295 [Necator americanus]|uniref:Unspecific monooxygenase n=1 Tax=Necator americanus TaxID=51031 RepID=A0ABR1E117_NECAM
MILLLIIAVLVVVVSYYRWQLDYWKRRGIPGPPGIPFLGNLYSLTDRSRPVGLVVKEWTKVYGKVYGIQEGLRRTLVVSDVEIIRELFMTKFECFYGRKVNTGKAAGLHRTMITRLKYKHLSCPVLYLLVKTHKLLLLLSSQKIQRYRCSASRVRATWRTPGHSKANHVLAGDVENDARVHLFESQGMRWKRLRAIASPAFSSGALKKIRPTVEDSVLALIELFDKRADQRAFDILTFYKQFAMDVISRIAMGQKGSRMFVDDKMSSVDKIFRRNMRHPIFFTAVIAPIFRVPLRKLFFLTASKLKQSTSPAIFEKIYRAIDARIEERERTVAVGDEASNPIDFIDFFLDARAEQKFDSHVEFTRTDAHVTKQLTREEIAAQCFMFLLAGFDTTANSLAYVTYLLAKNSESQRRLQEEIDHFCCSEAVSYETLGSMRYLDCVIKEGLRMYPLASNANSRRCMKSTTLGHIQVEEGEYVLADTFTLHHSPEVWGEDADEFRPERWMDKERPVAAWLSFGLGPRQCIGMRLARMEEKLVLAHLLKRYDIVATCDTENSLTLRGSMTISPASVTVQLRRRKVVL